MIGLAAAVLAAAGSPAPAPTNAACAAQIRRGIPERVASGCWRLGPLTIGMDRAETRAVLGAPDAAYEIDGARATSPAHLHDDVYLFPRDLSSRLAIRPEAAPGFKLLELTFDGDRLIRISNSPGARVTVAACPGRPQTTAPDVHPADFTPFERFAGVRVGEPMTQVRRAFGPSRTRNRSGDFFSYWPLPLTLDSYDGRRLSGFAVAADEGASIEGAGADLALELDPATCLVRGVRVKAGSGL